jgi:hypothetical protein
MNNIHHNTLFKSKEEIIMYKKKIENNKSKSTFIIIDDKKYKLMLNSIGYLYFDWKDCQATIYVRTTNFED